MTGNSNVGNALRPSKIPGWCVAFPHLPDAGTTLKHERRSVRRLRCPDVGIGRWTMVPAIGKGIDSMFRPVRGIVDSATDHVAYEKTNRFVSPSSM